MAILSAIGLIWMGSSLGGEGGGKESNSATFIFASYSSGIQLPNGKEIIEGTIFQGSKPEVTIIASL